MRYLVLTAFLASTAWASPAVQSSQFTAFNSNAPSVAIQAGAAGEEMLVVVALPCTGNYGLSGMVSGWRVLANGSQVCGRIVLDRTSDGTETSVVVPLNANVTGEALVLRISGMTLYSPFVGGTTFGFSAGPDAMQTPSLPSAPTLHLTFAGSQVLPTLAPSGYSNALSAQNGAVALMLAEKSDGGGAPENAGPWVIASSKPWRAQTISIQ